MRPGMAVTDACGESVQCIHCHPQETLPRLRHDQSPEISRIYYLSTQTFHSDLESVGFDIDSAHP